MVLLHAVLALVAIALDEQNSDIKELRVKEHHKYRHDELIRSLLVWNRNLTPRDRRTKFCTIISDPFSFFRGANHQFFRDMKYSQQTDPSLKKFSAETWIQGDLHVENYGSFNTAEGSVTYNINDFDEAVVADFQYDVWRLTTSLLLALDAKKFELKQTDALIDEVLFGYLDEVALAADGFERTLFTEHIVTPPMAAFLRKVKKSENRVKMLDKWAPVDASCGCRRFNYEKSKGKLTRPSSSILRLFTGRGIREYYQSLTIVSQAKMPLSHLTVKDIAQRNLAGTGSLGAGRYYVLVEGPTEDPDDDVILDVKEQGRPAPFYYLGSAFMKKYTKDFGDNDAHRHNIGLLSLLRQVDPWLGYFRQPKMNDTYSVRQRSPWKKSMQLHKYNYTDLLLLMNQYGQIIGADHAKAANSKITRRNNTFTGNFCPHGFATKMKKNLKLESSVPQRAQRSVEAGEFLTTVKRVAYYYANRTREDFKIFRDFAYENLNLANCDAADANTNEKEEKKVRQVNEDEVLDAESIVFASGAHDQDAFSGWTVATLFLSYISGVASMALVCSACRGNDELDADEGYYLAV